MAADPEFLEPLGIQPWDDPAFASDEQMAILLGLESPTAPQPGEEIFIPDLENCLMPQPNAVNFGSSERSIAEVVYAFGYTAARLAHLRRLLNYSPSRDTDFDPFAPFDPPRMQEAVDAVRSAVKLERGRIRINAMGRHVLNVVLAYGAKPDTRLFDMHNAIGAGAYAVEHIEAIHAEREAFEQAMDEEAKQWTTPMPAVSNAAESPFILNDAPAARNEALTSKQILAAYEDDIDGYDAKTRKVDLSQLPPALRLVAIQNVVAAYLDSLGELPPDVKLYTLTEAEQLLATQKRGTIELVGGVTFKPRAELYPVTGKSSLDVQFQVPGMTKNVLNAALAVMAEIEQTQASSPDIEERTSEVAPTEEHNGVEAQERTISRVPNYEIARVRFASRLAAELEGTMPDDETLRWLYEAITSYEPGRNAEIVGTLYGYCETLGRSEAQDLITSLRNEIPTWPTKRRGRQAQERKSAPPSGPTFAARTVRKRGDAPPRMPSQNHLASARQST